MNAKDAHIEERQYRCESQECPHDLWEHNPLPGYEHHLYGCGCDGCMRWYWSLK